jgi:microcompartment protein CcmK/EutM
MLLARVVGPVWGARHADGLHGHKILEVETRSGARICALDGLGAGPGEWVLLAHGSRVRDLTLGPTAADKDIIVAIVDGFTVSAHPALPGQILEGPSAPGASGAPEAS